MAEEKDKKKARARAKRLYKAGIRKGKAWGEIKKILGYDPRHKGGIRFKETTPAQAAVAREALDPFLTPDDQFADIQFDDEFNNELADLDFNLENLRIDTQHQIKEIGRAHSESVSDTNDEMIARGIFTSSIRDAELNDLEATRRMQEGMLNDHLDLAVARTARRKLELAGPGGKRDKWDSTMRLRMVENAAAASEGLSPNVKEAVPASVKWSDVTKSPKPSTPAPTSGRQQRPGGDDKRPARLRNKNRNTNRGGARALSASSSMRVRTHGN